MAFGVVDGHAAPSGNYDGYKLVYGSKSLNDVKSAGHIPLTICLSWLISYYSEGAGIKINNITVMSAYYYGSNGAGYGGGLRDTTAYFDLDSYYKGDLEQIKSANVTTYGSVIISGVTRWLEPI